MMMEESNSYHHWINLMKCMAIVAGTYHAGLKLAVYHTTNPLVTSLHVGISIWLFAYGTKTRLFGAVMFAILSTILTQVVSGSATWCVAADILFPCICYIGCLIYGSIQEDVC